MQPADVENDNRSESDPPPYRRLRNNDTHPGRSLAGENGNAEESSSEIVLESDALFTQNVDTRLHRQYELGQEVLRVLNSGHDKSQLIIKIIADIKRKGLYKSVWKRSISLRVTGMAGQNASVVGLQGRQFKLEAAVVQVIGQEPNQECESCAKRWGPFEECVVKEGEWKGGCANCQWTKCKCSFRQADETGSLRPSEQGQATHAKRKHDDHNGSASNPEKRRRDKTIGAAVMQEPQIPIPVDNRTRQPPFGKPLSIAEPALRDTLASETARGQLRSSYIQHVPSGRSLVQDDPIRDNSGGQTTLRSESTFAPANRPLIQPDNQLYSSHTTEELLDNLESGVIESRKECFRELDDMMERCDHTYNTHMALIARIRSDIRMQNRQLRNA